MPKYVFFPSQTSAEVEANTKLLVAARREKLPIRFGCASCRCGTCAVTIKVEGQMNEMADDERALLAKMGLPVDGSVRLSCRARLLEGTCFVDLAFQDTYSPDDGAE